MKKKKQSGICLLSGIVLLALFGCGNEGTVKRETETEQNKLVIMCNDLNEVGDIEQFILDAEKELGFGIELVGCSSNPYSREAQIKTLLAEGDSSVDLITINDEMMSSLVDTGYLEDISDVMTKEVLSHYPSLYMEKMSVRNGRAYSVPYFMDILCFWINREKLEQVGMDAIADQEAFLEFLELAAENGFYGYGGAWEKSYVYNEIGLFINLFGGDMLNWEDGNTKEAVRFLHDMVSAGYTSLNQVNDQYDQMMQKFFDGETGCLFMYTGSIPNFIASGMYRENQIEIAPMPDFSKNITYISTWQFVLNAASKKKDMAKKFLEYMAGKEGSLHYAEIVMRLPVRDDSLSVMIDAKKEFLPLKQYIDETTMLPRCLPSESTRYIETVGEQFQRYVMDEISLDEYYENMEDVIAEFF